jgi:hypothetical protein
VKSRYLVLIALLVAGLGVLFGTVPSGTEPDGVYVDCGPALFHEWASLPSPDCAGAYQPFQTMSLINLAVRIGFVGWAAVRWTRQR